MHIRNTLLCSSDDHALGSVSAGPDSEPGHSGVSHWTGLHNFTHFDLRVRPSRHSRPTCNVPSAPGILRALLRLRHGLHPVPPGESQLAGHAGHLGRSILYVVLCFLVLPESPRWLVSKGRMHDAKLVLQNLRGHDDVSGQKKFPSFFFVQFFVFLFVFFFPWHLLT
jgi:hypothetical protein